MPGRTRVAGRLDLLWAPGPHRRAPDLDANGGNPAATPQGQPGCARSLMSFGHPWVLAIAWLPALWVAWEWRDSARRTALALKAAGLAAVLLALAEPRLVVHETKVAVAILVDTSASVTPQDLVR